MADINITCQKCGKETTISEFVDDSNLKCHSCGTALEKPGGLIQAAINEANTTSVGMTKSNLRVKRRKKEDTAIKLEDSDIENSSILNTPENSDENPALELRPKIEAKNTGLNHAAIAGILFLALAGGMWYLRYGGILPSNMLALSLKYSWIIFLAFQTMIVLKALTDNIMQGILCLLIPGYFLFYLFAISDNFYLRAILAGLLVGIGQDASVKLQEHAGTMTAKVNEFMSSGGGDIR